MNEAFETIKVLVPHGLSKQAADSYIESIKAVPFRRRIGVERASFAINYSGDPLPPKVYPSAAAAELDSASELVGGVFRSLLVLKYPNPLVGKTTPQIASMFSLWSKALRNSVPADFDIVYCGPRKTDQAAEKGQEYVPCDAYVISRAGASKLRQPESALAVYELEFVP